MRGARCAQHSRQVRRATFEAIAPSRHNRPRARHQPAPVRTRFHHPGADVIAQNRCRIATEWMQICAPTTDAAVGAHKEPCRHGRRMSKYARKNEPMKRNLITQHRTPAACLAALSTMQFNTQLPRRYAPGSGISNQAHLNSGRVQQTVSKPLPMVKSIG